MNIINLSISCRFAILRTASFFMELGILFFLLLFGAGRGHNKSGLLVWFVPSVHNTIYISLDTF
jgi:hypothetical protein